MSEKITLIFVDADQNSSKFWSGEILNNGSVYCEWGRVGSENPQHGTYKGGVTYLNKKIREKKKKGYVEAKTVTGSTRVVGTEIAKKQIQTSCPLTQSLINELAKANIHQITTNSEIHFSDGVFSTPLGIVSEEGLEEARQVLSSIHKVIGQAGSPKFYGLVNEYLKIVPQKVGRNVKNYVDQNFSTPELLKKQLDLLESLEVSVKSATITEVEKIFDVAISVASAKDKARLEKNFYETKRRVHNYDNVKVKEIYNVDIKSMSSVFDKDDLGNHKQYYHGTNIGNCLSILKSGLRTSPPSTAAIAGKLFGNGIYGADSSSKSLGYSLGRWGQGSSKKSAWLFVCDFAMGRTYFSKTYGGNLPRGYDSISALSKNTGLHNNEFIVYQNHQVNIRYLIECAT